MPGFVRVAETVELGQGELSHYTLSRVHDQGGLGRVWLAFDKNLRRRRGLEGNPPRQDCRPTNRYGGSCARRRSRASWNIPTSCPCTNWLATASVPTRSTRCGSCTANRWVTRSKRTTSSAAAGAAAALEFQRLLQAFTSVCHAMAYAHSRRVIHRDLKPANVMLGSFGEVVVLDWGLAKVLDTAGGVAGGGADESTSPCLGEGVETLPGQILGTPAYMAPEQALGKLDEIDALTDVYGLGAILYRILTGERPHQGRDSQSACGMRRRTRRPSRGPSMPAYPAR